MLVRRVCVPELPAGARARIPSGGALLAFIILTSILIILIILIIVFIIIIFICSSFKLWPFVLLYDAVLFVPLNLAHFVSTVRRLPRPAPTAAAPLRRVPRGRRPRRGGARPRWLCDHARASHPPGRTHRPSAAYTHSRRRSLL